MPGDASRENGKLGGRPVGSLNPSTIKKLAIRNRFLERFEADADKIYDAQLASTLGTKFLVARDRKSGKFIPVNEEQTKVLIESGQADTLEIWERPPSASAFTALSDRSIDRPTEHHEHSGPEGGPIEFGVTGRLAAARKRLLTSGSE